jgi:hypothetical protein
MCCSIQPGFPAPGMRLGSKLAGHAVAAEHLLNERVTDTEHVRQGAL